MIVFSELIARSGVDPRDVSPAVFGLSHYPPGQRHEVLSVALAEQFPELLARASDRDLVLHVTGAHHGRCRPLPPVVFDEHPVEVVVDDWGGVEIRASSDPGLDSIGSGVGERFWKLIERYGWWGLSYLEAILMAAERRRSRLEFGAFRWDPTEVPILDEPANGRAPQTPAAPLSREPRLRLAPAGPTILLGGLSGNIPLGYLAALGTLRTLDRLGHKVALSWVLGKRNYTPELHTSLSCEEILGELCRALKVPPPVAGLDKNLKLTAEEYRAFAAAHPEWACALLSVIPLARGEVLVRSKLLIPNQRLVAAMVELSELMSTQTLARSLFEEWTRANRDKGRDLRLDPADRRIHATQWSDPASGGALTRHGANRLAIEALAFFPVFPGLQGGKTVGFNGDNVLSWPIWSEPLNVQVVETLVNLPELQGGINRRELLRRGVVEVYRARRYQDGHQVSLTVAQPA
jgi:hypothetical protein